MFQEADCKRGGVDSKDWVDCVFQKVLLRQEGSVPSQEESILEYGYFL